MNAQNNIATDLFYKIRSRFIGLKLGNELGEITILPEEARFFDFDYTEDDTPIGHVSISLAEDNSMKVYFSHGITEDMDPRQKDNWYGFLKELRVFAKRRLLSFDTRDIAKDNLDQRDYGFLSKNSQPKQPDTNTVQHAIGESKMGKSGMYGSKNISYQKLEDTRLIIKHNKTLEDDTKPGARSRNISALFVENAHGERFKYPFVHLAGARAMQRHIANGGVPYDSIGESIVNMSKEIAQLKGFGNYVVKNDLMNSDTNAIVERGTTALTELRTQLAKLSKQKHYEAYKDNFQAQEALDIPDDTIREFTEKFTVHNFKEDIKEVFPVLFRLMQTEEVTEDSDTIEYNDVVNMTETSDEKLAEFRSAVSDYEQMLLDLGIFGEVSDETLQQAYYEFIDGEVTDAAETISGDFDAFDDDAFDEFVDDLSSIVHQQHEIPMDHMAEFESWVNEIGEEDPTHDVQQKDAIRKLKNLVQDPVPVGVDGINAIESIKSIIDDEQLNDDIKQLAQQNPEADVRPLIKEWMVNNAPEVVQELRPDAPEELGAEAESTEEPMQQPEQMNVQEVAEFITSFYDTQSKSFPKGPEGVCTMVGKKFGEQAEQAARTMVERMAPQQSTEQNADLQELSGDNNMERQRRPRQQGVERGINDVHRIKKLAGLNKQTDESGGQGLEFNGKFVEPGSLQIDGVDTKDYPDFVDAYIAYAEYTDGTPLSDKEVAAFDEQYYGLAQEKALDSLY